MNILIVGSGGREHALAWKILQSPWLSQLYMTNPPAGVENILNANISDKDIMGIVAFSVQNQIELVVIGGEAPLAAGLSDALQEAKIPVFGPSRAAALIETSKAFAKDFMSRYDIPTARYARFNQLDKALQYLKSLSYPIVIKASGLAAGKGVFLPTTQTEAESILQQLLEDNLLGDAGTEIIIEERLQGEEISLLAFTDGFTVRPMPPARDHKRLQDGDKGPNTGGMGVFASVTLPSSVTIESLTQRILQPTIDGLRAEGTPFVGVIYAGLMLTANGPHVLEFNCRFGDPETQVLLPLLETDLIDVMKGCVEQRLADYTLNWSANSAACVVLASEGYPAKSQIDRPITGLTFDIDNTLVFQAGTRLEDGQIVTAGGRVLGVTGMGHNLQEALQSAYERVAMIHFEGMQYRHDIGQSYAKQSNFQISNSTAKSMDHYAQAGVDIAAGNRTVKLMSAAVKSTYGPEVLAGIGAFGGMYDASSFKTMDKPVLVASTDGIGTKVHLAAQANCYDFLGHDIVNHSINDILVQGAKPLFFLDYLATAKLDPEKMAAIVTGMAEACRTVNCALLGGETAEMPGVYLPEAFDVAGTIVGVVERDQALPRANIQSGDVLLGLASSGPHTNGYSLIRKIFQNEAFDIVFPELGEPLSTVLLKPHRCYLPVLQGALADKQQPIKGLVHITGGGFLENIPRVLPASIGAEIQLGSWPLPPLFKLIQQKGEIPQEQMYRVFNMGIGMVIITAPAQVSLLRSLIKEELWQIGELVVGEKGVILK